MNHDKIPVSPAQAGSDTSRLQPLGQRSETAALPITHDGEADTAPPINGGSGSDEYIMFENPTHAPGDQPAFVSALRRLHDINRDYIDLVQAVEAITDPNGHIWHGGNPTCTPECERIRDLLKKWKHP